MNKLHHASLAMAMALTVAGCTSEAPVEDTPEGVIPGIEIDNARMMLAPVNGNPAAVYFDLTYTGERGLTINGAEVEGAKRTEVHDTMEFDFKMQMGETGPIAMPKGETVTFEPGGKHLMAFELNESVTPGSTVEVAIKVSGGDKHKFLAEVKAAGDDR
ncbi:MAG: copper chaperone PCu(A)C [Pseudomonadota bacterium]